MLEPRVQPLGDDELVRRQLFQDGRSEGVSDSAYWAYNDDDVCARPIPWHTWGHTRPYLLYGHIELF